MIIPAAGWVRVSAHITGIPAAEQCDLIVIDHAGTRHVAASWLVSPNPEGATITGATIVAPADLAAIAVQNVKGREFITADV